MVLSFEIKSKMQSSFCMADLMSSSNMFFSSDSILQDRLNAIENNDRAYIVFCLQMKFGGNEAFTSMTSKLLLMS